MILMIHLCTVQKHQIHGYREPGLLSQMAFCQPCKTMLVHYRACVATGELNQNWLGAKFLPMAIVIYPMVSVHLHHLLGAQCHSLWPNGREGPPTASPLTPTISLPPPTYPPSYKWHLWYYRGCKILPQKPAVNTLHGRISYETLAIGLLYLYSKSCMAII